MWFSSDFPGLCRQMEQLVSRKGLSQEPVLLSGDSGFRFGTAVSGSFPSERGDTVHLADDPLWTHLLEAQRPAWRWSSQYGPAFWTAPPRAILFDLDGTLIDSFEGILGLFLAVLAEMGRGDVSDEAVRPLIGRPLDDCFACFLPEDAVERAVRAYRARYEHCMLDISPPFPGTEHLLERLRAAGIKVGVVSNKRAAAVREIVRGHGWQLDTVYGEGEGINPKPAPDLLLAALEALRVRPEEALYVGDSTLDAAAARAAGSPFVALTTGAHDARELAAHACGSFPSVLALARGLGMPPAPELPPREKA